MLHDVMERAIRGSAGGGPAADRRARLPAAICLGIAGVDREEDALVVADIMRRIGQNARILIVNDALVALEAGMPGQPGVVVIAGTGSIAYGRNARGEARAPAAGVTCSATREVAGSGGRPCAQHVRRTGGARRRA